MKGVEKLLSIVLAGSMVIGICACNQTGSGKSRKDDDDDDWDDEEDDDFWDFDF